MNKHNLPPTSVLQHSLNYGFWLIMMVFGLSNTTWAAASWTLTNNSSTTTPWTVGQLTHINGNTNPIPTATFNLNITVVSTGLSNPSISLPLPRGLFPAWKSGEAPPAGFSFGGFTCTYTAPVNNAVTATCTQSNLAIGTSSLTIPVWVDQLAVGTSTLNATLSASNLMASSQSTTTTVSPIQEVAASNRCVAKGGTLGTNLLASTASTFGSFTSNTVGANPLYMNASNSSLNSLTGATTTLTWTDWSIYDGYYAIANRANIQASSYDGNWFTTVGDHTTLHTNGGKGDPNARMMVMNASYDPSVFYEFTQTVTPHTNYEFSNWAIHVDQADSWWWFYSNESPKPYKQAFAINRVGVDDNNNGTVDEAGEEQVIYYPIAQNATNVPIWKQAAAVFNSGAATQIKFILRNDGTGGNGNDLAIDDLLLAPCSLATGNVSGVLYKDLKSDNTYESTADTPLAANVSVELKDSAGIVVATAYTNSAGAYAFNNVPAGTNYTLAVVTSDTDMPANAAAKAGPSGANTTAQQNNITVPVSSTLSNQNFGFSVLDYSDAPLSYVTATHRITGIRLGNTVDDNAADISSSDALGDDTANDDEDGVSLPTIFNRSGTVTATVNIQNAAGYLNAWADWNRDGDFLDSGEQIVIDQAVAIGDHTINITLPSNAVLGTSFIRFRVCNTTNGCQTPSGAADSGEVEDYMIEVTENGHTVSGKVFLDANVNAVDEAETGIQQVTMVLYDRQANSCRSVRTDASGFYQFAPVLPAVADNYVIYEAANETIPKPDVCPPVAKDPVGYRSVNSNIQTLSVVAADITDVNFADVAEPSLLYSHERTVAPENIVFYAHQFNSKVQGSVNFSLTAAADSTAQNWQQVLYDDSDCNGQVDNTETPLITALSLNAGDKVCLLVKVLTPADVVAGARQVLTLQSQFSYGDGTSSIADVLQTQTDITHISSTAAEAAQSLELIKRVWNVSRNASGTTATPGETLQYTIEYHNLGNTALDDINVYDSLPNVTQLVSGSVKCDEIPLSLTCTPTVQGIDLHWLMSGKLPAGEQGSVSYQVRVE